MTVSYTYNRPDRVAQATRDRVLEAAARLGYAGPHPGAQSLRRGRTATVGVVLGEHLTYAFDDPEATQFLAGVASVCVQQQLGMTLIPVTGGSDDAARIREAAVDALILWTTVEDDPILDAVAALGLPAVVHGGPAVDGIALVGIDDRAAARAVGAVAFAGSRAVAVVSFPFDRGRRPSVLRGPDPQLARFPVTRHRLQGYAEAARLAGVDWSRVPVVVLARNDGAEAETAVVRLLHEHEHGRGVDAIAAMSDELALGVLGAAHRLGITVPDGLAVTGWDDTAAAAPAGLTTIAQSLRDQGRMCARAVTDLGSDEEAPPASWRLVERASTR